MTIKEFREKEIKDQIHTGLNMCRKALDVDGSVVIPSLIGKIYEERGTCQACKHIDSLGICRNKQSMYDTDMSDKMDWWYCAEFERNGLMPDHGYIGQ